MLVDWRRKTYRHATAKYPRTVQCDAAVHLSRFWMIDKISNNKNHNNNEKVPPSRTPIWGTGEEESEGYFGATTASQNSTKGTTQDSTKTKHHSTKERKTAHHIEDCCAKKGTNTKDRSNGSCNCKEEYFAILCDTKAESNTDRCCLKEDKCGSSGNYSNSKKGHKTASAPMPTTT